MTNILSKKIKFNGRGVKAEWYLRKSQFRFFKKLAWQRNFVFICGKKMDRLKYCEGQAPKNNQMESSKY